MQITIRKLFFLYFIVILGWLLFNGLLQEEGLLQFCAMSFLEHLLAAFLLITFLCGFLQHQTKRARIAYSATGLTWSVIGVIIAMHHVLLQYFLQGAAIANVPDETNFAQVIKAGLIGDQSCRVISFSIYGVSLEIITVLFFMAFAAISFVHLKNALIYKQ
ncbi:MAG: hypothetical protein A2X77_00125 [Gammaproteobacteria bacterium GWE2_42_36]|nr:MAG: hypothetical protein A2X77_00125 [Gammaproteobacteria bacterium GWE2_42_36]HCU04959.1 hypothetical protein [Coxiellaceae bacterium]